LNHNASAYRIEHPDGNYELVPESEGEPAEGEVNVVEVQQDLSVFKPVDLHGRYPQQGRR
jgi:hypothetical protein